MKEKLRLPDSELEIMLIIWEFASKVSTSEILQKFNDNKSLQLLQSYLKRLEEKKFLKVEKLGRLNYYIPQISLEEYRNQETNSFLNIFYKKSSAKLFASLIANDKITESELDEIKKMLELSNDKNQEY